MQWDKFEDWNPKSAELEQLMKRTKDRINCTRLKSHASDWDLESMEWIPADGPLASGTVSELYWGWAERGRRWERWFVCPFCSHWALTVPTTSGLSLWMVIVKSFRFPLVKLNFGVLCFDCWLCARNYSWELCNVLVWFYPG